MGQQAFCRSIYQLQPLLTVESEHRHIDLFHHLAQQSGSLQRSQPMLLESIAQGIDLDHHLAQSFITPRAASPDGIILLPERRENVGQSLQWPHDPLAQAESEAQPDSGDHDRQRPLRLGRVVAAPKQDHGYEHGRKGGRQRHQQQAVLKAEFSARFSRCAAISHGWNYEL